MSTRAARFCENCGRRSVLPSPIPGDPVLGLDRVQSAFRFCPTCSLAVGLECWNSESGICIVCAPRDEATPSRRIPPAEKGTLRAARRSLGQLADAVLAVQRFEDSLASRWKRGATAHASWQDAWWEAGLLILQTEGCGRAAGEALLLASNPDAVRQTDLRGSLKAFVAEYQRLIEDYRVARDAIENRLMAAGRSLRADGKQPSRPLHTRRSAIAALVTLALAASIVLGGVAVLIGVPRWPFGVSLGTSPQFAGGVQGASGGPGAPSSQRPVTPTLVAQLDFNVLRIGRLEGASKYIGEVTGDAQVVSFPSPFDRSVRLSGAGPDGFCTAADKLGTGWISIGFDVYREGPPLRGSLELIAAPAHAKPTAARIPLRLLDRVTPEQWYRVHVTWGPGSAPAIDVIEEGRGPVVSQRLLGSPPTSPPSSEGVCLAAFGMAAGDEVLLDNLRVEQ